jgi:hypothetical protein
MTSACSSYAHSSKHFKEFSLLKKVKLSIKVEGMEG